MLLFGIHLWWDEERDQCSFNALTAVLNLKRNLNFNISFFERGKSEKVILFFLKEGVYLEIH